MSLLDMIKNKLPTEKTEVPAGQAPVNETLEDVLMDLAKWGSPRVGQYGSDNTWHCHIEVNITPIGAKFEVKSDFKRTTPMEAALQCRENLHAAVKAIGGQP